jgi:hypothetical protein
MDLGRFKEKPHLLGVMKILPPFGRELEGGLRDVNFLTIEDLSLAK